jgi:uncharacterized protein YacL
MLHAIRAIFVLLAGVMGWWIGGAFASAWQGVLVGVGLSGSLVLLEFAFARKFISVISVFAFGIVIGFVVGRFVLAALYMMPTVDRAVHDLSHPEHAFYIESAVVFVCVFVSVIAILHTKDDLKFVVPFIELKREGAGAARPMILDTSVIIDGRIADVIETKLIDTPIIVPRFVLNELQQVSDSQDKLKRNRGRRGLDILNRMRKAKNVDVQIHEAPLENVEGVDAKLVRLAKILDGRIVTNDFNLNKVAQVQGVEVINVNDIANAMRPAVLQGEKLVIKILRAGDSPGQGVGYLEDGTMVVAETCSDKIGQVVELVVTNILQTSAGRLIFARPA